MLPLNWQVPSFEALQSLKNINDPTPSWNAVPFCVLTCKNNKRQHCVILMYLLLYHIGQTCPVKECWWSRDGALFVFQKRQRRTVLHVAFQIKWCQVKYTRWTHFELRSVKPNSLRTALITRSHCSCIATLLLSMQLFVIGSRVLVSTSRCHRVRASRFTPCADCGCGTTFCLHLTGT